MLRTARPGLGVRLGTSQGRSPAGYARRMTHSAELSRAIDQYEAGATTPAAAIVGLSPDELNAVPVPGTWSIRQIVVHLWESDTAASHRMRRIAAEDLPLIIAYDETAMADKLSYDREDLARVCRLFEENRRWTASWLRRTPESDFARAGVHNRRGKVTLSEIVGMYVDHLRGHMAHLLRKRELLGKPLRIDVP